MPPKEDSNGGVLIDDSLRTTTSNSSSSSNSSNTGATTPTTKEPKIEQLDLAEFYVAKSKALRSRPPADKELWWIHGKGYDLEEFVARHPGGREAILLGRGRDCTALVESYHPFSSRHTRVLEKFLRPGAIPSETTSSSSNSNTTTTSKRNALGGPEDFFYELIKERVAAVLRTKGIDPLEDRGATTGRALYYLGIAVACAYTGFLHAKGSVLGSFFFAIFGWLMGALGHDAGHFAASHNHPVLNEWGVWAMALICNPVLWQQQHTYGHHSYTNEFDHDPDLHHFHYLLRVHRKIRYESHFRNQTRWLYVGLAYCFVVFGTCFYIPLTMIQRGTLYHLVDWHDKDRPSKYLGLPLHTLCYAGFVMVAPFYGHSSGLTALAAVALHVATLGVVFAIFSQINHLNEPSLSADLETRKVHRGPKRDPRLAGSWAVAQVETSNNFASQSFLWHILSNGLNLQIEHHLFPGLNHCHLHHIAPVVRETCEEFGVDYKSYDTWADLMSATLRWYEKLSVDESRCQS